MADVGGKLYAAICYQIWVRVDGQDCLDPANLPGQIGVLVDGVCQHHWKWFWTDPAPASTLETGLRGLTKVKYEDKDVLSVSGEGGKVRVYRIDPDTGVGETELEVKDSLANTWNLPIGYVIAAYNNIPVWYGETGSGKRIIGLMSFIGSGATTPLLDRSFVMLEQGSMVEGDGWYILRNAADSYELIHIPNVVPTPMVAVRAAAQSPFPDECNAEGTDCAIYFGGYDANKSNLATPCYAVPCTFPPLVQINTHNSGWIVKGLSPK